MRPICECVRKAPELLPFPLSVLSLLVTMSAAAATAGEKFLLNTDQMDRITASGVAIIADGMATAAGFGYPAIGETSTHTSVTPTDGSSVSLGTAYGPDGSSSTVSVLLVGEDTVKVLTTMASGDDFSFDATPTAAFAEGLLSFDGEAISGGSTAMTDGGEGITTSGTELAGTWGEGGAASYAWADGYSIDGALSLSATDAQMVSDALNLNLVTSASGEGDTLGSAAVGSVAQHAEGDMSITSSGLADAVGDRTTATSSQSIKNPSDEDHREVGELREVIVRGWRQQRQ